MYKQGLLNIKEDTENCLFCVQMVRIDIFLTL